MLLNEQELNRKLAEWAGLIDFTDKLGSVYSYGTKLYKDPPNFTQSLDACFKWLVPKLKGAWAISIRNFVDTDKYTIELIYGTLRYKEIKVQGERLALTLCLAISELIDIVQETTDALR